MSKISNNLHKVTLALLSAALLLAFACGGGGGSSPVSGDDGSQPSQGGGGEDSSTFPIRLSADQTQGPDPLTVNFTAEPLGGEGPYLFEWFFDGAGDTTVDSNAQNPHHTFNNSTVARVVVTDSEGNTGEGSLSIIVNNEPVVQPQEFDVRVNAFNAQGEPIQAGRVPLNVQFRSEIIGGEPPFSYEWDFEGDGTPDSFVENPQHTFTQAGTPIDHDNDPDTPAINAHEVTLTVTDGRGREVTSILPLTVTTEGLTLNVNAQPRLGQAPLEVQFISSVDGGQPPYQFSWEFGDGQSLDFQGDSQISHVYNEPGEFRPRVSVLDSAGQVTTSAPIEVDVLEEQALDIEIDPDVTDSAVPFTSSISTLPTGGSPPIQYDWTVRNWTDQDGDGEVDAPGELSPLSPSAIVAPTQSNRPNPNFHFANSVPNASSYAVRVGITDANGATAFSEWTGINTSPPTFDYRASRFLNNPAQGALKHMFDSTLPRNPQQENLTAPGARANPVVLGHPSGVMYVFGGERINDQGQFESTVPRSDGAWAIRLDRQTDGNSQSDSLGPFADGIAPAGDEGAYPANTWVLLNTFRSNPFPAQPNPVWCQAPNSGTDVTWACPDSVVSNRAQGFPFNYIDDFDPDGGGPAPARPVEHNGQNVIPSPSRSPSQRSTNFIPVGMADGALVRQPVQTNPQGSWNIFNLSSPDPCATAPNDGFPGSGDPLNPGSDTPFTLFDQLPTPTQSPDYLLPFPLKQQPQMMPQGNWQVRNNSLASQGGSLIAYIVGGRTEGSTPNSEPSRTGSFNVSPDVQKYIVPGFGIEDLPMDNVDLTAHGQVRGTQNQEGCQVAQPPFQLTMNQIDSWVNRIGSPDRDQLPGDDNTIDFLSNNEEETQLEPELPEPIYGHEVVLLDSRVQVPQPTFPEQGFTYLLTIGGKTSNGEVTGEVRLRNPSLIPGQSGSQEEREFGVWSLEAQLQNPRYDFNAQVIPPKPNQARPWRILVWGGINANNEPVEEIELLELDDPNQLQSQDVLQFQTIGQMPIGRFGSVGGYVSDELGVRLFEAGGRTIDRFQTSVRTFTEGASGLQTQSLSVSPRAGAGGTMFSLSGTAFGSSDNDIDVGAEDDLDRYAVFGGSTEFGNETNWVELYTAR